MNAKKEKSDDEKNDKKNNEKSKKLNDEPKEKSVSIITRVRIPALDGSKNIANAKEVFDLHLDPGFAKFIESKENLSTRPIDVVVYELNSDAIFRNIFKFAHNFARSIIKKVAGRVVKKVLKYAQDNPNSLLARASRRNLDAICVTQHQIIYFCEHCSGELAQNGFLTFFLFKHEKKYYVAGVRLTTAKPGEKPKCFISLMDYGDEHIWAKSSHNRVVILSIDE
jgi:hypothetical protein